MSAQTFCDLINQKIQQKRLEEIEKTIEKLSKTEKEKEKTPPITSKEEKWCRTCGQIKPLKDFYKDSSKKDGHMGECKKCKNARKNKWNKNNREKRRKIEKVQKHKREAMEKHLPHNWNAKQMQKTWDYFNNSCVLTGINNQEKIHIEHFIPLCWGHGGATSGNMYPMEGILNVTKSGKNPFVWIETQPTEYKEKFYNILVPYLAEQNKMQVAEFIDYVNWCFNHKRTIEEVQEDNKRFGYIAPSTELFYEYIANNYIGA